MLAGRRGARTCATSVVGLSIMIAACDFPRPPEVGGDGGNDAGNDDATAPSSACCVTAEECARIGASAPKPCLLGVCVHNECTTTTGSCDGDEDCSGDMKFCVADTCSVCRISTTCPVSNPVCDETSHSCRACAKDQECDSGACDMAAGTCVDRGAILYVSPAGTTADPCTRTSPCSLAKAASAVDTAHSYIVLLPGVHGTSTLFNGAKAILCGNDATFSADSAHIAIQNNALIEIRDLTFKYGSSLGIFGTTAIIEYSDSALTIRNVTMTTAASASFLLIRGNSSITIQESTFNGGNLVLSGQVTIDRSTFFNGGGIRLSDRGSTMPVIVSNSLFVSTTNDNAISIPMDSLLEAHIVNNTIVGANISCSSTGGALVLWDSNIIYNTTGLQNVHQCAYVYNLIVPNADVFGSFNLSEDPRFNDASNNDFHLKAGSPAIDAANPNTSSPMGYDRDGTPRPQGSRFDIGAYEARSTSGQAP